MQDPTLAPVEDATSSAGGYHRRYWTSRDGLRLYARDYAGGSGDARLPVICLHGLTRNSKDFADVAPWIAAHGRRVLVPDVRGRGLSAWDPNPQNYTPATYGRDVLDLMDSLGIARAVFVGTSMGGIIMMVLAGLRRRTIAAAVLNDVAPEIAPEGLERIASYVGKSPEVSSWSDAVAYVRATNRAAFPTFTDENWEQVARRTFREDATGVPLLDYDSTIVTAVQQGKAKAPNFIAWWLFRRLARSPTLLLRGARSDIVSPRVVQRMRRSTPSLIYAEVPDVGHAPMLTEQAARSAIAHFLDSVE